MPLALLASPVFLAALNFLLSGGLDLARREFDPNAIKPTLGEALPVAGATAAGAFAGPIGGAVAGATSPFLGSVAQLGLTTAVPLVARTLSSEANPNLTRPPTLNQAQGFSAPQQLVNQFQSQNAIAQRLPSQGNFSGFPQQQTFTQSPSFTYSPPSQFQSQQSFPTQSFTPQAGQLTNADQIRSLYFAR